MGPGELNENVFGLFQFHAIYEILSTKNPPGAYG